MADAPTPTVEYASARARPTLVGHFPQLLRPGDLPLQARRGETLGVIAAIRAHCHRAVWLEGGRVRAVGPAPEFVALYEGRTEG
jgi:hypothetical protein